MHRMLVPALVLALAGAAPGAELTVTASGADVIDTVEAARRLHGTPVRWTGGPVTLAEAADLLAVEGNRVVLADGLDRTAVRDLPAMDGLWWDGVLLVARTWGVDLLPAEGVDEGSTEWVEAADGSGAQAWRPGTAMAPPVLAPGNRPLRALAGPCLLEWRDPEIDAGEPTSTLSGTPTARFEPRFAHAGRGTAYLRRTLPDERLPGPEDCVVPLGPDGELLAALELRLATPWTASGSIAPGDRLRIPLPEGPVVVTRDEDTVRVSYTRIRNISQMLDDVAFGPDGEDVEQDMEYRSRTNEEMTLAFTFKDLPAEPLEIRIRGHRPVGERSLAPGRVDLGSMPGWDARPSATWARHAPVRVAWAGGARSLTAAVAALQAGGNRLVLPFGTDGARVRELPPYDGPWWGGALVVALTWGCSVQPAREPGQAATLAPGTAVGTAAGPWLVRVLDVRRHSVRTAAGVDRRAEVRLRIDPEPRLPPPAGDVEIVWATGAVLDGGILATVDDGDHGHDHDDDDGTAITATFRLRHLPDGPGVATVSGMLQARIGDPVEIDTAISLGGMRRIDVGGVPWLITLSPPTAGEIAASGGKPPAARLRITGPPGQAHDLDPGLADEAGAEFATTDRTVEGDTLILDLATPPPEPLRVRVAADIDHGTVAVPFTIGIPLP